MPDTDDKQRIAELEREVARLRSQLATDESSDAAAGDEETTWQEMVREAAPTPDPADAADRVKLPSRRRAVIIGLTAGAVAFVAIAAIVMALSSVIEPLSKKAAGALEPFEGQTPSPSAVQAPAVKAGEDPMRVPGL